MRARRVLAAAGAGALAYASPVVSVAPGGRYPGIVSRLDPACAAVALTFDDGPDERGTRAMLEELAACGMRATFFAVGLRAARYPRVLAEVVAAGHEVGLHGHRHIAHALVPHPLVVRDLERGLAEVEDAAGAPIAAVRAPFGAASLATVAFARRRGLTVTGWSRWGWDWTPFATPASIAAAVTDRARPGDVLLLHDSDAYSARGSWRRTAAALAPIATALGERDLPARPFSELRRSR
jgi:peptidoglycan-N-acetylglucosamine deacetylase